MTSTTKGKIILLNGASSSGKSTLARALQAALPEPFWHYSIDHLIESGVLPSRDRFAWSSQRSAFFDGFHRSIPAFAGAGNNLVVEHIIEEAAWMDRFLELLNGFDVFFVGIHCPLGELERRERERGNRPIGDAKRDFETTHGFCLYDFEVDSTKDAVENAKQVIDAWERRDGNSAFIRMRNDAPNPSLSQ